MELIAVVMFSNLYARWSDASRLLNFGFLQYESVTPIELYNESPIKVEIKGYDPAESQYATDDEKEDFLELGNGIWLCETRVNLEDLSERLGISLPSEDFDTLGGFIFDLFGKIPVQYEKAVWGGHEFIIQDVEGHKINSVKIVISKKEE